MVLGLMRLRGMPIIGARRHARAGFVAGVLFGFEFLLIYRGLALHHSVAGACCSSIWRRSSW